MGFRYGLESVLERAADDKRRAEASLAAARQRLTLLERSCEQSREAFSDMLCGPVLAAFELAEMDHAAMSARRTVTRLAREADRAQVILISRAGRHAGLVEHRRGLEREWQFRKERAEKAETEEENARSRAERSWETADFCCSGRRERAAPARKGRQ
ncbi:MAG TPA: hypothetical protein VGZ00_06245 [Candidatus Baltobacteraceae bacterium]|jgi:hypothetical protein|nr:hypothetical protein [Candidatus Baltobacteraceae bacterium]